MQDYAKKWVSLRGLVLLVSFIAVLLLIPSQWYPDTWRITLSEWFGAPAYISPANKADPASYEAEPACPPDIAGWRGEQTIETVWIKPSPACVADDPYAVAAFVRGTNNVTEDTLNRSGLARDAVEKSDDLDGDGDPDRIHIRLEVIELNGSSPDNDRLTAQYEIAPGIKPGFWVFAPKHTGMATENFESPWARAMLRLPSPTIRIEQGDEVQVTLENSHYMPHTIHFHGVDHPFRDADGEGNDGVPITSEHPVMPGNTRTYNMQPRQTGTMFYHCHVQPQVHVMMGLQGMFVVEENQPDNWLQTLNIGAGHVRAPSKASQASYDREYDLHYTNADLELGNIIQAQIDPRNINEQIHLRYNATQAVSEFHMLNGRSFPYTFRESLVVTKPDEKVKLRVANGGSTGIALHTHGHKATITHYDGVAVPETAQITRDVIWISNAQRVDLNLETVDDGLHSYGSGVWLLHDHQGKAVTNNGIAPGGNVSAIVYEEYLAEDGWPVTFGMDWDRFFSPDYYRGLLPVFSDNFAAGAFKQDDVSFVIRAIGIFIASGVFFWALLAWPGAASRNGS